MFCTQTLCSEYFATIPLKFTPRMLYKIKKKKRKERERLKRKKKHNTNVSFITIRWKECFVTDSATVSIFVEYARTFSLFVIFHGGGKKREKKGGKKKKNEKRYSVYV